MRDATLDMLYNFGKCFLIGCVVSATVPFFVTVLHIYHDNLYVTWSNISRLHATYPWYVVVDALPFIVGITVGILGAGMYKLQHANSRLVERQLQIEEGYLFLKQLLEDSPIACIVVDKGFNLKYINQGALDMADKRLEDPIGEKCFIAMGKANVCSNCAVAKAFFSGKTEKSRRTYRRPDERERHLLYTAVPLYRGDGMIGVMETITDITEQVELATERKQDMMDTIETLVGLIELKDSYTGGHSQRVRTWAVAIAKSLNLKPEEIEDIEIAACLHDIGKIGISGSILNKPSKLTTPEYEFVKKHPLIGELTVRSIERLTNASRIIRHHHEFVNGRGYPDGLAGEDIPIGARVICVADAYDAMMSDRAYRTALGREKAMDQLRSGVKEQFDEQVVHAFFRLLKEEIDPPKDCVQKMHSMK